MVEEAVEGVGTTEAATPRGETTMGVRIRFFFTLDNDDIEGIPKIPIFRYKMQIFGRKMIKI